ncbi:dihydrodipicolinate synthase family protein [Dyadobacter sp. LHD-138]|uniref:dihydrodipicolinate synthase family protein n=1 Tax=Dyadobacter sp. LHD-138 TaxID=3071413 RepID=UPI0027E0976B|nr:dihydrodipicolinate synthase family protein [Dyadobacter sp. LHD-138]MDQ6481004.1 dihydrodipicolinate synthase family protein [Dyadobacter sp. LHD-138]
MSSSTSIFKGVWPALFTPIHPDGALNVKELEKLLELMIVQELDGIYLLGSTGQGFLFSEKERKEIASATIEIVNNRLPVMVQVGAMSTDESIRLAKHAAGLGACGISSVGPIYYGSNAQMAFEHYKLIAGATEVPFFPYQIGNAASGEMIDNLLSLPQVLGMKLTTDKMLEISSIRNRVGDKWKLFSGADELICQAALCGTVGAIGTTYNMFGPTCKQIRQRFLDGETQMAVDFMLTFQKFIEKILPYAWSFFNKSMQLRHNITIGEARRPLMSHKLPWTDQEIIAMMDEVDRFYIPASNTVAAH